MIASGRVSSLTDLLSLSALEPLGVASALVDKAIYTGDVDLKKAVQAVGDGRLQNIPPDIGSTFAWNKLLN